MNIDGKVAIITGGASGLGEATAKSLADMGARVAIFDQNDEKGEALSNRLGDAGLYIHVDVASEAEVSRAIADTLARFGNIHICCNYAGVTNSIRTVSEEGPFPLDEFTRIIQVNLIGTFNVLRLVATEMAGNQPYDDSGGRGCIINTSSVSGVEGRAGQAAYSASKGGVIGMTLPIARDLARYGIRCNTLIPGLIDTPMFQRAPEPVIAEMTSQVVYPGRLGRADEVAQAAIMLIENEYMNGECIRVDGGIRLKANV